VKPHLPDRHSIRTIREALQWASSFLAEAGTKDPRFEAELLLRHVLRMDRTRFLSSLPEQMAEADLLQLAALCRRRSEHEPIQYILGEQTFYGRSFHVAPGVLIPRPETEILVEEVLRISEKMWDSRPLDVADVGTGSGAISLTLACERPDWNVLTVDVSTQALAIARNNAERLGVADRVRFFQGDLLQPFTDRGIRLDVLVSNPPYIPSGDLQELDREVRDYEPSLALDGGTDGLAPYRRICEAAYLVLKPKALIAFEVGAGQSRQVEELLRDRAGMRETRIVPDLAGIERVVLGWREG
jgi:release factor glutamine methyltransferase